MFARREDAGRREKEGKKEEGKGSFGGEVWVCAGALRRGRSDKVRELES